MRGDKYQQMIDQAAHEFAAAKAEYQGIAAEGRAAAAEFERLRAEAAGIDQVIAEFEAGRALLDADEFIKIEDRRRYLAIRVKQQQKIAGRAQQRTELEAEKARGVASKYRGQLAQMLAEDARAAETARRAELDAVLR
jgi:chromosome segregation ATPase